MSYISPNISTSEVIPVIDSDLFTTFPTAHLAIGIVANGNTIVPGLENEFAGYSLLRGNVYGKQKNYMPLDELNADGTETDFNDARSIHFAIIENALQAKRVVGGMRLVIKSPEDDSDLPIEEHYPEAFIDGKAPVGSTESSRLIGRHEDVRLQRGLKWLLFTAGVSYINDHDLGPVYGAVEPVLLRGLQMENFPAKAIAKAKFVEEFNATKLPIKVDMVSLTEKVKGHSPDLLEAMQDTTNNFIFSGTAPAVRSHGTAAA